MEKNVEAIIKNSIIGSKAFDNLKAETDEQRRIAALEDRITALESALTCGTITAIRTLKLQSS
ncbi:hypothetical protein F157LOC_00800 [Pectobacterium brasiliense]|uniref:hypothetical protein n=1 Tax=Pectobacterium brasiliense TaxID=180957 RepID=UPI000CE687BD|nr:hypothetical protein [Pectobacterium brasiliense]PPE61966.1 hypothetical protein F157LOC_00800 [Pectobacterium brasiliense]